MGDHLAHVVARNQVEVGRLLVLLQADQLQRPAGFLVEAVDHHLQPLRAGRIQIVREFEFGRRVRCRRRCRLGGRFGRRLGRLGGLGSGLGRLGGHGSAGEGKGDGEGQRTNEDDMAKCGQNYERGRSPGGHRSVISVTDPEKASRTYSGNHGTQRV